MANDIKKVENDSYYWFCQKKKMNALWMKASTYKAKVTKE